MCFFVNLWHTEYAVELWHLQDPHLPDRENCFSQCPARSGFCLVKPQMCRYSARSVKVTLRLWRTLILDLSRWYSFSHLKFKQELCSVLYVGGKKVTVSAQKVKVSVPQFAEVTLREKFAPFWDESNKLLATTLAEGLRCQPHWWRCSAAL